jgi:hypothetical protein
MYKKLFIASLALNIALVILCGLVVWKSATREQRLIKKYQPEVTNIYRDFDLPPPANPEKLEDLYDPIVKLMKELAK